MRFRARDAARRRGFPASPGEGAIRRACTPSVSLAPKDYRALDDAALDRVRLHDLRHSYCSMAVRAWRLDEVKAYAGHADIAMTMRYVHHVPAHDAADRLSAVVSACTVHPEVHRTAEIGAN